MGTSPHLGITFVDQGQKIPEVTHNDGVIKQEWAIVATVKTSETGPPGGEVNGDYHLIIATATGDFTGLETNIAIYQDGWIFLAPTAGMVGMRFWHQAEGRF